MVDYVRLQATAQRLIQANGRQVTLIKLGRTPDDPAMPWRGTTTARSVPDTTVTRYAVFVPPSGAAELGLSTTNVDEIKRSEQICIVEPGDTAVELEKYDEIEDADGKRWKITFSEVLKPADLRLLYFFGVRR